jgi:predicted outer membrane protein
MSIYHEPRHATPAVGGKRHAWIMPQPIARLTPVEKRLKQGRKDRAHGGGLDSRADASMLSASPTIRRLALGHIGLLPRFLRMEESQTVVDATATGRNQTLLAGDATYVLKCGPTSRQIHVSFPPMNTLAQFLFRGRVMFFSCVGLMGFSLSALAAAPWKVRQVSARSFMNGFGAEPLATDDLRPLDRAFLGKAVETVRQQMRLAEVGVSQATNNEVRSHAQQLVADYRQLNDTLEALIRRKGGMAGAPVGGTSETYQKLVETSGAAFDSAFVRAASQMSDQILTLFEQAAADAKDTDVRELAAAELPVLRSHRNTMTELKKTTT